MKWDLGDENAALIREFDRAGYHCTILQICGRHLCGYVDIPRGNALFGRYYDDEPLCEISVHGGLTYADGTGDVWTLGFDCAHSGDADKPEGDEWGNVYRDADYVERELRSLADQIAAIDHPSVEFKSVRTLK
tara:strand:+ start:6337 stop:6735 length:399 start_codon:yes stop_codon:yes gene_type:complete